MKAAVLHKAGDLRIEEREAGAPGPGEVKVRMAAGGVCGTDLHYYNHGGFGSVVLRERQRIRPQTHTRNRSTHRESRCLGP